MRWLAAVALFIVSLSAHALVPLGSEYSTGTTGTDGGGTPGAYGWYSTGLEACAVYANRVATGVFSLPASAGTATGFTGVLPTVTKGCAFRIDRGANGIYNGTGSVSSRVAGCPANSTAVTGGCQCNTNFDESGGQCVPHTNACTAKSGKVGVTNWTQGYSRTPDEGDVYGVGPVTLPPGSGEVCDSGCKVSLQTSGPGVNFYVSQSPTASGLYRRSADYPNLNLGTECTPGTADAPAQKTSTPPPCPGSVGEVGGKVVCVGTASAPVTTTPIERPSVPPIAGNPPAGEKPATGDASGTGSAGRTPAAGNGGPAGGPAGAAVGGKGGGAGGTGTGSGSHTNADGKEEKDPCGAPGQADCNVKVNETGTPQGAGTVYDSAKTKMDETKGKNDEQLTKAAGTGDKGFFEPVRSMFWAPPVASCQTFDLPQQVGGLKLDPCAVVDGVRGVMAFIWAGIGLFMCFGMIKRSF